ncbi:hypothetical protein JXA34_02705 [Patescibacteria group bacterium]|nr:hypothetical protein [Patescibacteria group bacterium]
MNLFTFLGSKQYNEKIRLSSLDRYIPDITFGDTESDLEKDAGPAELNTFIIKYIGDYMKALEYDAKEVESPIEVDRLATRIGRFYERIRQVVDWKEEHLVRRSAIERILKRRLITRATGKNLILNGDLNYDFAESFMDELLRTGYFSHKLISKKKVPEILSILKKYDYILKNNPLSNKTGNLSIKRKIEFYNWITEVAASEIEEALEPAYKEHALMNLMTNVIYTRIKVKPAKAITNEEKYIQTYVAVHRSIFNLDSPIISFRLLKYKYNNFCKYTEKDFKYFSDNIEKIWNEITEYLEHPWKGKFFEICEKYDAAYLIIGDAFERISKDRASLKSIVSDRAKFGWYIKEQYKQRMSTLKRRLTRSAIYSTISIFVAGGASLIVFEFPIAKWIYGEFKPWAIVVDIMIPTAMMFILVAIIKLPSPDNFKRLLDEIYNIIYGSEKEDEYEIILNKRKNPIFSLIFTLIYVIGGIGSLYLVYIVFLFAGVPWTSLYIDAANVAIVVFAAMLIRQKSRELTIEEDGGLVEMFLNFFSVPMAKIGMWLSNKWKEYNFVSVFLSALIDVPFSTFLSFIADWRKFIKEKSAEIH